MKNALVAYFSAEAGTTRRIAEGLADAVAADLYEIKPEKPYSEADLRWTNPLARCNREKLGKKDVPVEGKVPGWAEYDTVYLGFPIWYYGAPNVIQTFCKGYDWSGKKIYVCNFRRERYWKNCAETGTLCQRRRDCGCQKSSQCGRIVWVEEECMIWQSGYFSLDQIFEQMERYLRIKGENNGFSDNVLRS